MPEAGEQVRQRNDPSVIGVLTGITKDYGGRPYVQLQLAGGGKKWVPADQIEPMAGPADALADYAARQFSDALDLAQLLTHVRLTGDLADIIYSMESTNTDFHAFQFKPVIKLLNSPSRGLLIADEVGLGKTIEAGLIWTELQARYDVERLLVVCPKSLQQKWVLELRNRFGSRAQAVGPAELLATVEEAKARGGDFALVATLSGVRAPRDWESGDDTPRASTRARLARQLSEIGGGEPIFDMVVFDEAHHLRNPMTQQHQTARLFIEAADYKLMLTATPINLKNEDLRSILRLIEPELFDRAMIFEEMQRENQPIVAARELALSQASLAEVADALGAIMPGDLLKTDRRLEILKEQLRADRTTDTPARRVEIASRLEEMSMLGGFVNRTRRRDVAEIQVKRRVDARTWTMSPEEQAFYDGITETIRDYAWENEVSDGFLLATSQRMLASSFPAAWRRWRSARGDLGLEGDERDDRGEEDTPPVGPLVEVLARHCDDSQGFDKLKATDSKFALFRTALDDTWATAPDLKLIVFSSFQGTLDYLEERLADAAVPTFKMHGAVKEDRFRLLDRFRDAAGRAVLLTSEIGGEGLDLQFCRLLINYDLPWNPMRIEQRVGRIDRIGQTSQSIEIINLLCQGTIEARIYQRLFQRLGIIENALGGFEPILGELVAELEGRLLDPKLTTAEIEAELDRAAEAAEYRKKVEDQLEAEAAGLIAHGDMILQRIKRAHDQQKWIQPQELLNYVRTGLEALFPGSALDRTNHPFEAYELRMTPDCHWAFTDYLQQKARRSDTLLRRAEPVTVVFGKRPPAARGRVEVLTNTHPFIRFLAARRSAIGAGLDPRPALTGRLSRADLSMPLPAGRYGLVVQRWSTGGVTPQDRLIYAGADLDGGRALTGDEAEALLGQALANFGPRTVEPGAATEEATLIARQVIDGQLKPQHDDFINLEAAGQGDKRDTVIAVLQRQLDAYTAKAQAQIAENLARGGSSARIVPAQRAKLARYAARMTGRIRKAEAAAVFDFDEPVTLGVAVVELA